MEMASQKLEAEAKIRRFVFSELLNQDQAGRRLVLLGSIDDGPAILLVERAAFSTQEAYFRGFVSTLSNIENLGANDIYSWFLANCTSQSSTAETKSKSHNAPPELKLSVIHPCTEKHIAKYSSQVLRIFVETPETYALHVRPYIEKQRLEGRLNWIFNILEGRTEQEDVIYREYSKDIERESQQADALSLGDNGFLLLPDLNWDRNTLSSLHLLAIVERRDIWSVRDLRKSHVGWLASMRRKIVSATVQLYPEIDVDQLKLYVHYQPTYYHFHIHITHVMLESGATQAVGKAIGLDNIIAWLRSMEDPHDHGMAGVDLVYHVGEASELWINVLEPSKHAMSRCQAD